MALLSLPAAPAADKWEVIAASSPTSGSAVNFTGISGYKKLRVRFQNLQGSYAMQLFLQLNGIVSSSYTSVTIGGGATNLQSAATSTSMAIGPTGSVSNLYHSGEIEIDPANLAAAITVKGFMSAGTIPQILVGGVALFQGPVTQVSIIETGAADFVAGSIYLEGIKA